MTLAELVVAAVAMACAVRAAWISWPPKWDEAWIWGLAGLILCDTVWLLRL